MTSIRKQIAKGASNHLLTKIIKNQAQHQQEKVSQQCLYGVFCAHLRAKGKCQFPHKRSHYQFLNLVPPINCVNEEEGKQLSKAEKKQQKIIQKTINEKIDVGKLNRLEHQLKSGGQKLVKQEVWQQIDQKEKRVLEIVNSFDVSEIFIKLNEAKNEGLPVFEVKRKSMLQLRKKNQKLYIEMIDKEYRIANRLIKAFGKNKSLSLYDLYVDINHDTLKSVRTYFQSYFKTDDGIPQESQDDLHNSLVISNILEKLLFTKPEQYQNQFYTLRLREQNSINQIKSNIQLFNMLVPFSLHKKQSFNKFYLVNGEECTYTAFSHFLGKDYLLTFHSKFKAAPEYPFGNIQENQNKFINWASKIHSKYVEGEVEFKLVIILYNTRSIVPAGQLQQFEKQKLKERVSLIKSLLALFNPVLIFLTEQSTKAFNKKLAQNLQVEKSAISNDLVINGQQKEQTK